jgi:LmbE family N-acetylglucosaminyl deacetylase
VSRRLAAVFAHPDDDAFGISGTCALHAGELELMVVFATSGEAGRISDATLATRQTLGRVREAEALAAYHVLGIEPELRFLRYPDGGLAGVDPNELGGRIEEALTDNVPDVLVTFGPDGITGHADHVTVGRVATTVFGRMRERLGDRAPQRLLHNALSNADLEWLSSELRSRGLEPPDPNEPFQPRGVPDETIAVRVDCSPVVKRKLDALREHRTQAAELEDLPQDLWPTILATETFVQAWPEREPGSPVMTDVFEGLRSA